MKNIVHVYIVMGACAVHGKKNTNIFVYCFVDFRKNGNFIQPDFRKQTCFSFLPNENVRVTNLLSELPHFIEKSLNLL